MRPTVPAVALPAPLIASMTSNESRSAFMANAIEGRFYLVPIQKDRTPRSGVVRQKYTRNCSCHEQRRLFVLSCVLSLMMRTTGSRDKSSTHKVLLFRSVYEITIRSQYTKVRLESFLIRPPRDTM